jgi:hypothetical protein
LRSIFNPGFSAAHLMTLAPYILDKSMIFIEIMREFTSNNRLFSLEEYTTRLTVDVIGKVTLDADFDTLHGHNPVLDVFRERTGLMPNSARVAMALNNLEFIRRYRLRKNEKKMDLLVGLELDRALDRISQGPNKSRDSSKQRKRTIIDLAWDAHTKNQDSHAINDDLLTSFRQKALISTKTFIFAGHVSRVPGRTVTVNADTRQDTTSSTIAYTLYLLHYNPTVRKKAIEEISQVFHGGPSVANISAQLRADPFMVSGVFSPSFFFLSVCFAYPRLTC